MYTYDCPNPLIKVESKTTGSYSPVVEYLYDGLNRRVKKDLTSGADIVYIYDGWRVIEERIWHTFEESSWWVPLRQYVYGGRYIDERLIIDFNNPQDFDNTCEDGRWLYAEDRNWNVSMVTDDGGIWSAKMKYDPYGSVTVDDSGPGISYSDSGNQYYFQGRYYHSETGLYYFRNRDYNPKLGRGSC